MDWQKHFVRQTDYQVWANEILFDALAHLEESALREPQGLFFTSIHHTVDHMLAALDLWSARLQGETIQLDLKVIRYPDWSDLRHHLQEELRRFRRWLEGRPASFFAERIAYARLGGAIERNAITDILTHLMNHFTHHRGQISAVATRLGAPAPEMDYIYFVRAMETAARERQAQIAAQQQ